MRLKLRRAHVLCFLILVCLCWFFPYTGDDWAWGSQIGLDRLKRHFSGYNGRYLGNLIVLVLTRFRLLRSLTVAFCLTGIACCTEYLTRAKSSFYLTICLIGLMPRMLLRQAIVWTSGFSNYGVSTFLTMLLLCFIWPVLEAEEGKALPGQKPLCAVVLFPLGMANTTIMENVTVYHVLLGLFVTGYLIVRFRRVYVQYISYLAGTLAGTFLMFSNPAYRKISEGGDSTRNLAHGLSGILKRMSENYFDKIYEEAAGNNVWLLLALFLCCAYLYYRVKGEAGKRRRQCMHVCLCLIGAYTAFRFLSILGLGYSGSRTKQMRYFEGIATAVWYAALALFAAVAAFGRVGFAKILFLAGSILALIAPLFLVQPIGDRCFFVTYVMLILLLCELLGLQPPDSKTVCAIKKVCLIFSGIAFAFYLHIYYCNDKVDRSRLAYVREQAEKGETEIKILRLPYETYLWNCTPEKGSVWQKRYKLFYGLPADISFKPVKKL